MISIRIRDPFRVEEYIMNQKRGAQRQHLLSSIERGNSPIATPAIPSGVGLAKVFLKSPAVAVFGFRYNRSNCSDDSVTVWAKALLSTLLGRRCSSLLASMS